jgi:hypothetical protein
VGVEAQGTVGPGGPLVGGRAGGWQGRTRSKALIRPRYLLSGTARAGL